MAISIHFPWRVPVLHFIGVHSLTFPIRHFFIQLTINVLFKVTPGAKILSINTDKDALAVGAHYGYQPNFKDTFSLDSIKWITKFPWDKIQNDYDGIHHEPSGSRIMNWLMSSWDVESTAWFNRKYLQDAGRTKIRPEELEA